MAFCCTRVMVRSPPRMSAAALSAAVDSLKFTGDRPHSQAEPTMQKHTPPNASRSSGGSAREGKDSHSRQWRLSMAVFLNRNKRPQAAPIEVAELLSEKPPPSHTPPSPSLLYCLCEIVEGGFVELGAAESDGGLNDGDFLHLGQHALHGPHRRRAPRAVFDQAEGALLIVLDK